MPKVRDAMRLPARDGWSLARTRGSHRHYRHPHKPGIVTVAGKPSDHVARGTWSSIIKQAKLQGK